MLRTLVLVRHGHRDTSDRGADNGLSDKGRKQAEELLARFESSPLYASALELRPMVLSSARRRCMETVEPVARKLGIQVVKSPLLMEGEAHEPPGGLERRIAKFASWWKSEAPELTIACSHGDWLPAFTELLLGMQVDFRKGDWVELVMDSGGRPRLQRVVHP